MADIATLGLEVRSDQVEKGTRALDQLTSSAKRAEAAANGVSAATKNAGVTTKAANSNWETYDETVARVGIRTKQTTSAASAATAAVNAQSSAVATAAKRADVATRSYSAFGAALRSISAVAGGFLMNALATAMGVLMAELGKMIDWGGVAASVLRGLANAIEAVAPYAAMAAAGLALLYAPAIMGGIVSLIGLIAQLSIAALGLAAAFAAANPAAAFVLGVTAAVAAANIFRDELTQIFGFDIVGAAKDGVNAIIAAFLGAYDGIVASWNALPAAFGDLGYQAANKFIEGINWMVGEVVSIVNGLIAKINGGLRGAVGAFGGDASSAVQLNDLGSPQSFKMGGIANPYAGSAAGVGNTFSEAMAARQGVDYVGELGGAISGMASGAAEKLRELAGSFGTVEEAAGGAGKAAKEAADRGVKALADQALKAAQAAADFAKSVTKGFITDLRQGLQDGKGFFESFANAALNALDKIVDKLLDDVLSAIFQVNSAGTGIGGGGGAGGILGGLFSWLGFAKGGYTGKGAASSVAGVVHGGEYVFSKQATDRIGVGALDRMHRQAKGYASGGHVTPAMPRMHAPANGNGQTDTVRIVLQDDSGRMAEIADQRIQTASGTIVQVSVQQSTKAVQHRLPGMIANAQTRSM